MVRQVMLRDHLVQAGLAVPVAVARLVRHPLLDLLLGGSRRDLLLQGRLEQADYLFGMLRLRADPHD